MGSSYTYDYSWVDEMPNWPQQGIASWIPVTPPPQATFTIPMPATPAPTYRTSVDPDAGEIRRAVTTPSLALAPEFVQSYRNLFEDLLPKKKKAAEKPFDWVAFLMFWADLATAHEKKVYCIAS